MRLKTGDRIVVNSGERIPVDCTVLTGSSAVNNALLTGESVPVAVGPGDTLAGGGLLNGAPLTLEVIRTRSCSTLSVIDQLVERGIGDKPQAVRLADRVASVFISLLLVFAAIVFIVWWQIDPSRAATTAIAVLVVSCPCALSLATPAALAAASGSLLQHRLLITRGHALETLANVSDVVFDKTGTLTTGKPQLTHIELGPGQNRRTVLRLARILETGSAHPYADALRQASMQEAPDDSIDMIDVDAVAQLAHSGYSVQSIDHVPGQGVCAHLEQDGISLRLGSANWCDISAGQADQWSTADSEDYQSHQ